MIAYTYTTDGYFAGAIEDYGFLPNNATYIAPLADNAGFVQRWTGSAWEYVENHKGKSGYVDGQPFEVKEYGPLPDGFSPDAPELTDNEKAAKIRAERDGKLVVTDFLVMPDYPLEADKLDLVKAYRQALRDITEQTGFPGAVVWPEKPQV